MPYALTQLAADIRETLKASPGRTGKEAIQQYVSKALTDPAFVAAHLKERAPGGHPREVLYEDPELGFCILAHVNHGAKESQPHDHGKYWAIYGQAEGETVMSDWQLVEPARDGKPGKVRHVRAYPLRPGMAKLYNEGDIHSPRRDGPTRLIRIEGRNMDGQPRGTFEQV